MAETKSFLAGQSGKSRAGKISLSILPARVANQNAEFASSSLLVEPAIEKNTIIEPVPETLELKSIFHSVLFTLGATNVSRFGKDRQGLQSRIIQKRLHQ